MFAHRIVVWALAFALAFYPTIASAQSPQVRATVLQYKAPAPVAAGGASATCLAAGSTTTAGANPWTISGITFSTGTVVLGVVSDRNGGSSGPITAPVINGVPSTQVGTTVSDGTTNGVNLWRADVTSGGPGTIVISGNTAATMATVTWMVTGLSSSTPTQVAPGNGFAVQLPDAQTVTLTSLAANSLVIGFIGRNFPATQNPTTWGGVTTDTTCSEQLNGAGNGAITSGGHINSTSGTVNVTATATAGQSWQYSGLIAAAWN